MDRKTSERKSETKKIMITNLVIGSEGFIGKHFCEYLKKSGEKVIPFDIKRNKKEDGRTFHFDFKKIDRVYFLAWDVGGSKYLYQKSLQLSQFHWNLNLLTNIMQQIEKQKPKFLYVSSQLSEECDTVYGVTKRLGEIWTELLNGLCIRIWNAYGVLEPHDIKSHVISDFVYQAIKFKKIKMLTNGEEWRQFTHLDDISRAFHLAMSSKQINRSVYDVCSYELVQIKEVAKIVASLTGAKVIPGDKEGRSPVALNLGRVPGWLPEVTLHEGIQRIVMQTRKLFKKGR